MRQADQKKRVTPCGCRLGCHDRNRCQCNEDYWDDPFCDDCTPPLKQAEERCDCGHGLEQHELIEGNDSFGSVYVCTGGQLADANTPDFHPYDLACGCILDGR